MYALWGRILVADLSACRVEVQELTEEVARQFIGGSGLGVRLLSEHTPAECDPLGPENALIFTLGPLTGSPVPTSGRHHLTAKSPLTGIFGEADVGGHWGTALRRAGFDGVVIKGAAEAPVYLLVEAGSGRLLDAAELWGQDTFATAELLKARHGPATQTACIGPAGERLVRIASVMHDGRHGRAGGRGGLGAVMGAKKLKAVAVVPGRSEATPLPPLAHPEELAESSRRLAQQLAERQAKLGRYGTSGSLTFFEEVGDLPIRNWAQGKWEEGAQRLSGQRMAETILTGKFACGRCPVGCGRVVRLSDGRPGGGPEYETLAMLGANCLVDDLEAVARANELANRYGFDTISAGAAIAFAIEAYEKGLLGPADTGGRPLRWGDGQMLIELVEEIGENRGLGRRLGQGVRALADELGPAAQEFAVHVKGLELPAHDPRAYNSLALQYATANRGACHLAGLSYALERSVTLPELGFTQVFDRFGTTGKGELVARMQDLMGLYDSLKICKLSLLGGVTPSLALEWLNLATGWEMSLEEFLRAGERIFTLKRLFNLGCGVTRRDDTLPERILRLPRREGGAGDNLPPLEVMLEDYYRVRGWDAEGRPTPERLRELGLA